MLGNPGPLPGGRGSLGIFRRIHTGILRFERTSRAGSDSERFLRRRGAVNRTVILGIAFAVGILLLVIYSTMGNARFRCTVCMDYQGRSACRTASAATREQALRTATENACAQIASGVTDSIGCDSTPPTSVKWLTGY